VTIGVVRKHGACSGIALLSLELRRKAIHRTACSVAVTIVGNAPAIVIAHLHSPETPTSHWGPSSVSYEAIKVVTESHILCVLSGWSRTAPHTIR